MADLASPPAAQQPTPATSARDPAMEEMRRQAIVFKFRLMGEPAQEHWQGPGGTLARIRQWLDMPYTADVRPIAKVLNRYLEGDSLTAYGNCGGRNRKLTHGEALVAADCLARNMGREQAAYVVSARRQEKGIYGGQGGCVELRHPHRLQSARWRHAPPRHDEHRQPRRG